MGSLSPFHWLIVLLVIILLFGAKKIPELAKGLGQGLREFKKAAKEVDHEGDAAKPQAKKEIASDKSESKDNAKA